MVVAKNKLIGLRTITIALICSAITAPAFAEEGQYELGIRGNVFSAGGEPSNDLLGAGLFGRIPLQQNWYVGAAIDFSSGDFEGPAAIAGVSQDPSVGTIDANSDHTIVTAWIEKRYPMKSDRAKWYWLAGLGFDSPSVDDVSGPTANGGTFNMKTDASTEFMAIAGLGLRYDFANKMFVDGNFRLEHHFADWTVTDTVSGATGNVSDYTAYGIGFGVGVRF